MQTLYLVHVMLTQLQNAERINSVWDAYMEHCLKDDNKNHFHISFLPGNKDSGYHAAIKLSLFNAITIIEPSGDLVY